MSVFNKLEREEILLGPSKKYLPINELAEEFGYAIDHLSRLCRQGRINSIRKENGRWFATRESLIEYKRKAESVKKKVAITNLGGNQIKLAPSSPLQTADTHKPGRVYLGGFSKRASRYAFLGFLILLTIFSASAFAKNKSLIGSLKNLGKSFIDFGKEFAETSFPSIKFKYDNEKLLVEIGEKKFLKFNGLKNEIDNISDNFRGFSENLGSLTLKEMNSYSANLYNQYISPVVSPIHNLISLFFGNKKESEKTNTAELEKQIQELKNQLTEAQLKISGNEKIIITQIGQGEKVTTEVVTEKRIVTLPSNVEARLLSVEQYIEQGEQKFKTMELALSGVDQRFSYTPTIIIPSGTGGNQGVTILNPATTDSETVRVSNLLDVSGSADIDGSLTLGGNFTADTNTFFVNATNNRVGVGTTNLETALEVVGTASISGQLLVGGGMSINNGSNNGAALEISGTTSTSYLIVGNSAQFANAGATVSYSRFGTSLTSHASQISTASDLLITGDLELDGNLFIDGTTNFSGYVSSSFFYAQRNTAASPSFSFGVDQDTGLFSPAANTVAFSTGGTERLRIDSNGNVGINAGNAIDTKFEVGGSASISGDLTVLGDIGIGTSSTPFQLTVAGSGSFTGQLKATRNPTLAHSGTWPSFTNANDATLYINPLSPAADGNVIVYANGSNTKFVVDTEGDVFAAGNVTLVGTTTQATTNTTGDLLVEGNARLGDATTDKIKLTGTVLPYTLTSFPILIKASASQTTDIFRILDSNDNVALTLDQGTGLLTASSGFNFALGGSTATVSYSRLGTATTGYSSNMDKFNDLLISGSLEVDGTFQVDGTASHTLAGEWNFDSNTLVIDSGTNRVGIGTTDLQTALEVAGTASISGATTLRGITYTWPSADGSSGQVLKTNGSGALSWGVGLASNSLDFDELVDSMTLDANLTVASAGFNITITDAQVSIGNSRFTSDTNRLGINTTTPQTVFEVQGTASASYLLTGNTLQVGGFSSAAYSRFGIATTDYSSDLDAANDLLVSGALEVDGNSFFDAKASVSGNFQTAGRFIFGDNGDTGEINTSDWDISNTGVLTGIGAITADGVIAFSGTGSHSASGEWNFDSNTLVIDSGTNRVGIGTTDLQTALEVAGTASISGATTLRGITYTWPSADGSSGQVLKTNGSGALSWGVGLASNSLDFDELVDSMTLDANLTINRGANPYFIGIGSAPSTVLEVQGTASASYLLTGNTLQVGGYASAAYSRFGTADTGHAGSITTTNDLLISGDLEVDASAAFDGILSFYGEIAPDGVTCSNGQILKKTGANDWDCATDSGGAASNSLDFDELVASMSLDTFTDITFGTSQLSFNLDSTGDFLIQDNGVTKFIFDDSGRLGLWTAAPSTVLEVQGTASASYLLTGNTLQVGGYSSAAYSRFGTADTGYTNFISTTNDLLISGDLEVNATAQFDSFFRISNNNTRSLVVTDTGGVYDDIFVVDTTASSTNSGLTITGGPAQTGPLLELKSSGGTVLSKFSDEGGLLVSIASISAFTVTGPDFPSASISFQINTLDSETRISALSTKSVGFEVFGIASISHTLLVGPTKFNPIASLSKFFGNGGVWVTGALCVDDGETSTTDCGDASRAAGTIYSSNVSVDIGDLAENFPTTDSSIEAGDVVMPHYLPAPADLSSESSDKYQFEFVKKSNKDGLPMGVITDKPGVLLGGLRGNPDPRSVKKVAVVLSGRVPVKVSLENGPVKEGDRLAPSSILGIAAKAIRPGIVVGIALEPITSSSLDFSVLASDSFGGSASVSYGKALSFINLSYWVPPPSEAKIDTAQKVEKGLDPLLDYLLTFIKEAFDIVFEKGIIQTVKGIFDTVEVKDGITIYDKVTDDPYCISFENGIMVTTAGICGESKSATINQTLMSTPTPTPDPTPPPTPEPTPTPTPTPDPTPESTPTPEPTPII